MKFFTIVAILLLFSLSIEAQTETWRGLVVEPENRCSDYDKKKQYPYPPSVEDDIIAAMDGKIYGPYTGKYFDDKRKTDIEHIVAAAEAHDSGLCAGTKEQRKAFAVDPLNLTLAAPDINRCNDPMGKCAYDAAEWLPPKNKCWYANRIVQIKTKYSLSVDKFEADILEAILQNCHSSEMVFTKK
jgi:hypothetical protein